jgi:hypothetical protein
MSRFAGLTDELTAKKPEAAKPAESTPARSARRPAREGKKGILGYFSPELSRALNIMAIEEETSLQALMGEAFDLLLRNRGKHPFGER